MSKESKIKKRLEKNSKNNPASNPPVPKRELTPEERARIIRNRLANRPVIMFRYPNGKWNLRLIIMLVILVVAMIVALYFVTRVG